MADFEEINRQILETEKTINSLNNEWIKDLISVRREIQKNINSHTDVIEKLKEEQKLYKNNLEILEKVHNENTKIVSDINDEIIKNNEKIEQINKYVDKLISKNQNLNQQQIFELKYYGNIVKELEKRNKHLDYSLEISEEEYDLSKQNLKNYKDIFYNLQKINEVETEIAGKGEKFLRSVLNLPKITLDFWDKLKNVEGTFSKILLISKSFITGMINAINVVSILGKITQITKDLVLELDKQGAVTSQLTGQNRLYMGEIYNASTANRFLGISLAETGNAFRALYENFTQFSLLSKESRNSLTLLTSQMQKFQISGDVTAKIIQDLTKALGNTEKEAMNIQKTMFFVAKNLGLSVKSTMSEFSRSLEQLSVYGNKSVQIFKDLSAVTKLTGISISELTSVFGRQLDTFEGTANIAGKLNSILGKDLLNSVDLLYQSEEERLKTVLKSLQADGRNIQTMSKYERLTIANAIGFKDMDKFIRLTSMSLEELEVQQAKARMAQADQEKWNEAVKAASTFVEKLKIAWEQIGIAVKPIVEYLSVIVEKFSNLLKELNEKAFPGAASAFLIVTAAIAVFTKSTVSAFMATTALATASTAATPAIAATAATAGASTGIIASLGIAFKTAAVGVWGFFAPILAVVGVITVVSLAVWGLVKAFQALKKWWIGKKETTLSTIHMDDYRESVNKTIPTVSKFADSSQHLHKVQTKKSSPALWEISKVMSENNKEFSVELEKSNTKIEKQTELLRNSSNVTKSSIFENTSQTNKLSTFETSKNSIKNISIDVNFLDIEATKRSFQKAVMQVLEEQL